MHFRNSFIVASLTLAPFASIAFAGAVPVCPCVTDMNYDGMTDGADLGILLGNWGGLGTADFDGSGLVDGADLGTLLGHWGPCEGPANDECGDSAPLSGQFLTVPFCTAAAEASEPALGGCAGPNSEIGKDIWFSYVMPYDGILVANTCGSEFDTVMAIYGSLVPNLGTCPSSGIGFATVRGCNDDAFDGDCSYQSALEVPAASGDALKIRVGGYVYPSQVAAGPGVLNLTAVKRGDRCDIAHEIPQAFEVTVAGTNAGDTWHDVTESPCSELDSEDEWYHFVMPCDGTLTITTCRPGTNFDTTIAVYDACGGGLMTCNDDSDGTGCDLDGSDLKSTVIVVPGDGADLYIRVSGWHGDVGNFELNLSTTCIG